MGPSQAAPRASACPRTRGQHPGSPAPPRSAPPSPVPSSSSSTSRIVSPDPRCPRRRPPPAHRRDAPPPPRRAFPGARPSPGSLPRRAVQLHVPPSAGASDCTVESPSRSPDRPTRRRTVRRPGPGPPGHSRPGVLHLRSTPSSPRRGPPSLRPPSAWPPPQFAPPGSPASAPPRNDGCHQGTPPATWKEKSGSPLGVPESWKEIPDHPGGREDLGGGHGAPSPARSVSASLAASRPASWMWRTSSLNGCSSGSACRTISVRPLMAVRTLLMSWTTFPERTGRGMAPGGGGRTAPRPYLPSPSPGQLAHPRLPGRIPGPGPRPPGGPREAVPSESTTPPPPPGRDPGGGRRRSDGGAAMEGLRKVGSSPAFRSGRR